MSKADPQLASTTASGSKGRERFEGWVGVGKFLSLAVQLGLLVFIAHRFQLENPAFHEKIMPLAFGGFMIHYFLPQRHRLPFFLLLSLAGIYATLGFPNSLWLVGLGLVLIGVCHLPVPFAARLGLLLVIGFGLALLRTGQIKISWIGVKDLPSAVLPVLASMFMFRLWVYLYDLKHGLAPQNRLSQKLAYFFLLPNVVFPLFPVVDYSTYCQTYYDGERHRIYQKGIHWMLRGVALLILYRYINYYWTIGPEDVVSLGTLLQYLISNVMALVRVAGQFHVIAGLLHLFGFNLPETMHRFFLSASFTDFWRRANIYWKDFMQKVFFYPLYLRLRPRGETPGLALAMIIVFAVTWFFHAYQWFWLTGSFLFSAPDMLYWTLFGLIVIANSLYEAKHGRKRTLKKSALTFNAMISPASRSLGVFAALCILWSLWSSASLSEWLALWPAANLSLASAAEFLPIFLAAVLGFLIVAMLFSRFSATESRKESATPAQFFRSAMTTAVPIILLCAFTSPPFAAQFGEKAQAVVREIQTDKLSRRDAKLRTRGYYENLASANNFSSGIWQHEMKKPADWKQLRNTEAARMTGDFLEIELVPSVDMIFMGARFHTNRWGMRDKDYEKTPPANTYRIAVVGSSPVMGSGVADGETFEALLEERLNRESGLPASGVAQYEILNFAVGSYTDLHELIVFENRVLDFSPNAIFFVSHPGEMWRTFLHLVKASHAKLELPYEYLKETVRQAGIENAPNANKALKLLEPYSAKIMSWAYQRIVDNCRPRGILPIWIALPGEIGESRSTEAAEFASLARAAGFVVIDLGDVYANQQVESIRVAPWDLHPNAKGHQLIAARLYDELAAVRKTVPFGLSHAEQLHVMTQ